MRDISGCCCTFSCEVDYRRVGEAEMKGDEIKCYQGE